MSTDVSAVQVRDRALAKDPDFRWCTYCSSGFIASNPSAKTVMCPDCKITSCIKVLDTSGTAAHNVITQTSLLQCGQQWQAQHCGITCEQFAEWKRANDPKFADTELDKHLKRHGIDCPKVCKVRSSVC